MTAELRPTVGHTVSFGNLQAVPKMVQGILLADVIASIGSMDFVLGDTDR